MLVRLLRSTLFVTALTLITTPAWATYCVPPTKPAQPDPPPPTPPICEPNNCNRCSHSPCYIATGTYIRDFLDIQLPTAGMYPLAVSRRYDSSRPTDGPLGVGWSSSLTAHLYYAAYLSSSPSTYTYEADIIMPDGVTYVFSLAADGTFVPPLGRRDSLIKNADGTYSLTPQRTRSMYRFAADGSLSSLTDDFGNVITYTYLSGRLQRMADASGSNRYLDITWGPDGRIASLADNAGRVVKYFYEQPGLLTSYSNPSASADPSARSAYYAYTPGRFGSILSRIEDRWHRTITQLAWYSDGRLKSYTDGTYIETNPSASPGEKYTYTYSPAASGGAVTKTNSLGQTTYTYTATGLVNSTVQYDAFGNMSSEPVGFQGVRSYIYDGQGDRLLRVSDPFVDWWYSYDTNFPNQVSSIIPKNFGGSLSTDWAGWAYDYSPPGSAAPGALAAVYRIRSDTTTKDRVASYTYDSHGRVLSSVDDNNLPATTFGYNAAGDLVTVTRAGVLTTTYSRDALGNVTAITRPDGTIVNFGYDSAGRVASITLPRPSPASALNFVTTYNYDVYDTTTGLDYILRTDPNGHTTKQGFDALGHLIQAVDTLGSITRYAYQYGLLSSVTDANGNASTYHYTGDRQFSGVTFADGANETYVYVNGLLASSTNRNGQSITYTYDNVGRLTQRKYTGLLGPAGAFVGQQYVYQGQNLIRIVDQQSNASVFHDYAYDTSWRRTSETISGADTITYTYANGPATSITWAGSLLQSYTVGPAPGTTGSSQSVGYGYDSFGRVASLAWSWTPGPFTFEYNGRDRYTQVTLPNGQKRSYAYDGQGRLTSIANNDVNGSPLATFTYGYDYDWANGLFDVLGLRTSVNVTALTGTNLELGLTKYQYDSRYELTRVDRPDGSYDTWSYDAIGNRVSSRYSNYSYYKNGTNPLNSQRLRSFGGSPDFGYDAAGHQLGFAVAPTFGWDYAGRLTSAPNVSYSYDYLGRRTASTQSGVSTRYIAVNDHTVGERNTTLGVANDYIFGPDIDEPLAKRSADGSIHYYGVDGLGSVVLVTDGNSTITDSASYDAWGTRGGSTAELFGYTGREAAGTLWYYRARIYDPSLGRFLSEDPTWSERFTETYRYVEARPTSHIDPYGRAYWDRWPGNYPRQFKNWYHQRWKQPGTPDGDKEDIDEAYEEWQRQGRPNVKKERWNEKEAPETPEPEPDTAPGDEGSGDTNEDDGATGTNRVCVLCYLSQLNQQARNVQRGVLLGLTALTVRNLQTCSRIIDAARNAAHQACGCSSE